VQGLLAQGLHDLRKDCAANNGAAAHALFNEREQEERTANKNTH